MVTIQSIFCNIKQEELYFLYNKISTNHMQLYDLNPNILDAIFGTVDFSQQVINQYMEWHHNLDPSYSLVRSLLDQYLMREDALILKKSLPHALKIISESINKKLPRNFVRGYLTVIKDHSQIAYKYVNRHQVLENWKNVSPQILQFYLQAFSIKISTQHSDKPQQQEHLILPINDYQQKIKELINKRQFQNAMILIKYISYPQQELRVRKYHIQILFQKMADSRQASRAANFIKNHKIDPSLYPQVGQRLNKNMVRHFLKSYGWDLVQQIFSQQPEALACLVQDLLYKQKKQQALSVWWRYKDLSNEIKKSQASKAIKQWESLSFQQVQDQIINNSYFDDYFGPSDKERYLSLTEFGITHQKVIWIDDHSPNIELFVDSIDIANILSIDTESLVGKTKLQKKKYQQASIVQISLEKIIFVLDGNCCKDQKIRNAILRYIKSGRLVIGHALDNDLEGMLLSIGLNEKQAKQVRFDNMIDTCKMFRAIYPQERFSNLAYICSKLLGKEVCKKQTLTNWARRPLRLNQLHYAAMDAYIVVQIYNKFKEEVGQNMLTYFVEQDL